ncbi:MAG: 50S ribosomal protein L18 [Betaproteobacteria bacterium AqS2]|uniref:Large ribosomal subunit protein uL18 n=1 Tax=Candidatus Amphirhobacter heronislandensis TaxID=1732024 RepID=A0A930UFF0_9GAMM|nr:50S ribosomal protein L18 [Betaproteobacteria bacterium AqS2]
MKTQAQGKRAARLRRAAETRVRIARDGKRRIVVHRSGRHTYAQLIEGDRVLLSSSTLDKELRAKIKAPHTVDAAREVGTSLAAKIAAADLNANLAFDRSGFKYHGRIKALAEGMRAAGAKF